MYTKVNWKNHIVSRPRTFDVTENADGTQTLDPSPVAVLQQGTPVNAENLNHMDEEIERLSELTGDEEIDEQFDGTMINAINELARPSYEKSQYVKNLVSGETFKRVLGKISKAIDYLIEHTTAQNPHGITCQEIGAASNDSFMIASNELNKVGTLVTSPGGTINVNTNTITTINTVTLNKGIWVVQCDVREPASFNSSYSVVFDNNQQIVNAATGWIGHSQMTIIVNVPEDGSNYNLQLQHQKGAVSAFSSKINAVRIK